MYLENIKEIILRNELIMGVDVIESEQIITIYPIKNKKFASVKEVLNDFEELENKEWGLDGKRFKVKGYNYMNTTIYDVTMQLSDKYEENIINETLENIKYNASKYISNEIKLSDIDKIGSELTNIECQDFDYELALDNFSWSFAIKANDGEYIEEEKELDIHFEVIENDEYISDTIVKITSIEII